MHFEPPSAYLVQALAATIAGNEADTVLTNDGRFLCGHRAHDENGALGETCCPSGSPRPQMPTGFRFRQNAGLPYYYIHFHSKVCTFLAVLKNVVYNVITCRQSQLPRSKPKKAAPRELLPPVEES